MGNLIDLTGQVFGRWYVLERAENYPGGQARWRCRCECGVEKIVSGNNLRRGISKSCNCYRDEVASLRMRGKNHPKWKGGRRKTSAGYIQLSSPEFPGSTYPNQTLEHIVVMARHLGRPLEDDEVVHHKNGDRDDNRIENLELWISSHPPGQRVTDVVKWAKDILRRYEPGTLTL